MQGDEPSSPNDKENVKETEEGGGEEEGEGDGVSPGTKVSETEIPALFGDEEGQLKLRDYQVEGFQWMKVAN